ncbi:MAG: peptidoglycan-binding protein [Clostridia bacterium]|nr:peptidoglycan-binding protein [Clostridia bacterium]
MATNNIERDAIENAQRYLRHLSFHSEEIEDLPIDGIWEEQTRLAVQAFQRQQGLPVTGIIDRATWEILKAEYDKSVAKNSPPASLALFPRYPAGFTIKKGDTGFLTDTVQYLLEQLERLYHFPDYKASGTFDDLTEAYVRDFQRRNLISPTGEVDRETWDAMAIQHNLLLGYTE